MTKIIHTLGGHQRNPTPKHKTEPLLCRGEGTCNGVPNEPSEEAQDKSYWKMGSDGELRIAGDIAPQYRAPGIRTDPKDL